MQIINLLVGELSRNGICLVTKTVEYHFTIIIIIIISLFKQKKKFKQIVSVTKINLIIYSLQMKKLNNKNLYRFSVKLQFSAAQNSYPILSLQFHLFQFNFNFVCHNFTILPGKYEKKRSRKNKYINRHK